MALLDLVAAAFWCFLRRQLRAQDRGRRFAAERSPGSVRDSLSQRESPLCRTDGLSVLTLPEPDGVSAGDEMVRRMRWLDRGGRSRTIAFHAGPLHVPSDGDHAV